VIRADGDVNKRFASTELSWSPSQVKIVSKSSSIAPADRDDVRIQMPCQQLRILHRDAVGTMR